MEKKDWLLHHLKRKDKCTLLSMVTYKSMNASFPFMRLWKILHSFFCMSLLLKNNRLKNVKHHIIDIYDIFKPITA